MLANYIIKPDMMDNIKAQHHFYNLINSTGNIKIVGKNSINEWSKFAKTLYEDDSKEREINNLKIIRTILAYKHVYPIDKAKIITVDFDEDKISLEQLEKYKKEIRKIFAYSVDAKYYINIMNAHKINFDQRLRDIKTKDLVYSILCLPNLIEDEQYKFAYLNMIHFSDPNHDAIEADNTKIFEYIREHK